MKARLWHISLEYSPYTQLSYTKYQRIPSARPANSQGEQFESTAAPSRFFAESTHLFVASLLFRLGVR